MIQVVRIDNPPVNALRQSFLEELAQTVTDTKAEAIILIGSGSNFAAGADIEELQGVINGQRPPFDYLAPLLAIENSTVPVIAAIHGSALGAGFELVMACHYRVAAPSAKLGLPEVNLGLIPGAAGTQRLPRLVGLARALDICSQGKTFSAAEALEWGAIDHITEDDLLAAAMEFAQRPVRRTRDRAVMKGRRGETAPLAAIQAVLASAQLPWEEACRVETDLFTKQLASPQSKAMIHAFFAEKAASKLPAELEAKPRRIERVAVVGGGRMGQGIALALARAGFPVILQDVDEKVKNNRHPNIKPQLDHTGFDTVDLVIEAIPEHLTLKQSLFAELREIVSPECILATNTSSLDIDEVGATVGFHFFNPAHKMRLVEVIRGKSTGNETLATCMSLARKLEKVPVLAGNTRGFIGNRMMMDYLQEAHRLADEGVPVGDIDAALYDFGMPMGPFALETLIGHEVLHQIADQLSCPLPSPAPEHTITVAPEVIVQRCMKALSTRGLKLLETGVAQRSSDIDVVYILGYGFPAWRGGPMFYAGLC